MDNQFQKAVEIIPRTRMILQEFLGLLADNKPVVLVGIGPDELKIIKTNFPELYFGYAKNCYNPKLTWVTISKSKLLVKIATSLIDARMETKDFFKTIGLLLGYPQCCIENFLKYVDDGDENKRYNSSVITYDSYKSSNQPSKYCNNLLNFSTRINGEKLDNYSKFLFLNKNLSTNIENFQYISHIPCSYDCQESIKIGKETEKLLKKYAPKVQNIIEHTLSKPVLFFDIFSLIIFEGDVNEGVLYYQKVLPPYPLINSKLLIAIKKGNKIEINDNNLFIYKDDSQIYVHKKKNKRDGFILDFK